MSLVVLLFLIILIAFFLNKVKIPPLSVKKSRRVIIWYAVALALGTTIVFFLPKDEFLSLAEVGVAREGHYYTEINTGEIKEFLAGLNKQGEERWTLQGDTLKIDSIKNNVQIFVEKRGTGREVTVTSHIGDQILLGIDCTQMVLPPRLTFKDDRLTVQIDHQEFRLKKFYTDMTLAQLSGEQGDSYYSTLEGRYLYIQVPEEVGVEAGSMTNVIFVGEGGAQ